MRIKCVKCNIVEELKKEEIDNLVCIAKTYTHEISPTDYIAILSIIKGRCTDGKKHLFVYDDIFTNDVADLIAEHNKLHEKIEVMEKESLEVIQKIESLESEICDLNKKKDGIVKGIEEVNIAINNVMDIFENKTGIREMKIWS